MCAKSIQYSNNPEHQKGSPLHGLKGKRGKITNIKNIVHKQGSLLFKKTKTNQATNQTKSNNDNLQREDWQFQMPTR